MPKGIYKDNARSLSKRGVNNPNFGKKPWNHGIKPYEMTEEIRVKISKATLGEKNPHWKKDRSKLKSSEKKHLNTQYMYWSKGVKDRDSWKCRLSNSDCKGRLESHHIQNWIDYPELRYEINNGITLCRFHHPLKWEEEKRMIPVFTELLSVSKV
jgi:hypothetical protein